MAATNMPAGTAVRVQAGKDFKEKNEFQYA
jgi:hypothetical protein